MDNKRWKEFNLYYSFTCRNCVEVDEDLMECMKVYEDEQLKIEELSTTLKSMSFKSRQEKYKMKQ